MTLILPIEGAGDVPLVTRQYAAYGAIEIGNYDTTPAHGAIEVSSERPYAARAAIEILGDTVRSVIGAIDTVNITHNTAIGACEIMSGDSFLIMADIINANLTAEALGESAMLFINARLMIDEAEVLIKDFNFQKPTGRLGSLLNVTLAKPSDYNLITIGARVDFSLIVTVDGDEHPYPLMVNSKLSEDDFKIAYRGGQFGGPVDSITISTLDAAGDKFTLTPTRPVIMFDPNRTRFDDVQTDPENAIRDHATGSIILPIVEPVSGLTMRKILNRAYTSIGSGYANVLTPVQASAFSWNRMYVGKLTDVSWQSGCGFDKVITNIKDYPVRQANFTIEEGWHGGAKPSVQMFDPLYYPSGPNDNHLVILDVDKPLEFGVEVYDILLSYHKALSQRRAYRPDTNQVLLTYQYMGNDPSEQPQKQMRERTDVTYPVDTSTAEGGANYGEEGYIKHTLRERVREWYMPDDPENVLDTLPIYTELEIEQTYVLRNDAGVVVFNQVRVTSVDRTEHYYVGDLKIGHTRTLRTRLFTPDATLNDRMASQMQTTQREVCEISWIDDPSRKGTKLQSLVNTTLQELCVVSTEPQTIDIDGVPHEHYPMVPLIEANLGGYINKDDWVLVDGLVTTLTQTKLLRKRKGNQYDVLVTDVDHINGGGARNSIAEPVVGSTRHDQFEVRSRTILLKDAPSIAEIGPRIPEQVNAYELPRDRAIELGQRKLYRFVNPLKNMPIDLPSPMLALDRGSVVRGQTRSGYSGNFIVTGLGITGQSLGKSGEHRIFQNLETIELLPS